MYHNAKSLLDRKAQIQVITVNEHSIFSLMDYILLVSDSLITKKGIQIEESVIATD